MSIDELAARRFASGSDSPHEASITDMLSAVMAHVKSPTIIDGKEAPVDHVIVIVGSRHPEDGASLTKCFQAGSYRYHAQMGLMFEGMHMMRES